MAIKMKLLGSNMSPFVRKVLFFIGEAGLTVEHDDTVTPFPASEELLDLNPRGKIPAFRDGDLKLGESSVITAYLARQSGDATLYPSDAKAFAMALWYEKWTEEVLIPALAAVFFHRVIAPMMGGEADQDAIADALAKQPAVFDFLESRLAGREFLVGNSLTIADISVASPFANHTLAGEKVDAQTYPNIAKYLQALQARPAFASVLAMGNTALI